MVGCQDQEAMAELEAMKAQAEVDDARKWLCELEVSRVKSLDLESTGLLAYSISYFYYFQIVNKSFSLENNFLCPYCDQYSEN